MLPKQVGNRTRVAALEKLLLILENEPVRLPIRGENRRLSKHVGCKNRSESSDTLVDEGFGVLGLVSGDELKRLTDEGEAECPRWQPDTPESRRAEKEKEKERRGENRGKEEEKKEKGHGD